MADSAVLLQKVSQSLLQAFNAWQGASFMRHFAAKLTPELSLAQRLGRQQLLRLGGRLVDTEFEEQMDRLTAAWLEYRKSQGG